MRRISASAALASPALAPAALAPAALVALLASCGGPAPEAEPSSAGGQRDTLVIALGADANNLISVVSASASDGDIMSNIFYPLVDGEFDCDLKAKPALAKSWSWSEDGTVLSMELRDDITWSDGQKFTASDIAFTMELVEDPVVASPRLAYIQSLKEGARPKVIDDTHIEWHFTHAYDRTTQIFHAAVLEPVPRHVLADADRSTLRGHPFNTDPVVNGRWVISKWDRNQKIVLEPNPKWSGDAEETPKLRRVIFRVIPEYATRLVELETGGIDLMDRLQIADADRLREEHPEIKLHRRGWRSMDYVGWNMLDRDDFRAKKDAAQAAYDAEIERIDAVGGTDAETAEAKTTAKDLLAVDLTTVTPNPLFGDRDVRRALARAVDTDKLIGDLLTSTRSGEAYGRPSVGTITPALCSAHNDDIKRLAYDPAAAKAELAALGWTDTNNDGTIDKDGREFRFSLETNSENPRRAKAAVIIQANLADVGIKVDIEKVEFNKFVDNHRKKNFDAFLGGWSAGLFIDPTVIWHSGEEYEFNFGSYANPKVDRLIETGLKTPDPAESNPIWKEMQAEIYGDQPYLFLYWMDEIVGIHERFDGAKIDVQSAYRDLHSWSVPEDKVKYKR